MILISDCPIFLFETTAKNLDIQIEKIINFGPDCEKEILDNTKECLLLITQSFYNNFETINTYKEFTEDLLVTKSCIFKILKRLSNIGSQVYFPLVPKHFIYKDRNSKFFFEKDSKDIFINNINNNLFMEFNNFSNLIFLRGIENISTKISKDFFRFGSIYNRDNSLKIIAQLQEYKRVINIKRKKLIILDLDNTIWKGIIGEDSIDGISIDQQDPVGAVYRYAQNFFLELKNNGFLLAICSKNDENIALEALFNKNKSIFRKSDFVIWKINWKSKSENINSISNELNISLKETIFIDDSEYECDEVSKNCEGISIFKVPINIYKYPILLSESDLFLISDSSIEDKNRTKMYQDNIKRKELFYGSIDNKSQKKNWIKSLNIELVLERISSKNDCIPRIIQLFNRTNQFNLSGNKYDNKSLHNLLDKKNCIYYFGSTSDRIGNEGIISVVGFSYDKRVIEVNDFIVSCRVFGKYIEELMLIPIIEFAIKNKLNINFNYKSNKRNQYIQDFLNMNISEDNYLALNEIYKIKDKFIKHPVKIIDKTRLNH